MRSIIILYILSFISCAGYAQSAKDLETDFINLRKFSVSIGVAINYSDTINGKAINKNKFIVIGSGLMTYTKYSDSIVFNSVITAGHVVKYFRDNKITNIWIRPSWADTIKTNEYLGISIPLTNPDNTPNTFLYPDLKIDLGCIVLLPSYYNDTFNKYLIEAKNPLFPVNAMTAPYVGNQVWIVGYPGHVENQLKDYAICTIKPGYIAWRPNSGTTNADLKHITLVESNASFGNSGGPVFSLQECIELIGILTGGYSENEPVL